MSLSPSAKLLLSKHPELIWSIMREYESSNKKYPMNTSWSDFVANQTQPIRDWEVLFFKDEKGILRMQFDSPTYSIHSVRRLSDGEVFTAGDSVEEYGSIKGFRILGDNSMHVDCGFNDHKTFAPHISNVKKSKPVLFKTEPELSSKDIIILLEKILCSLKEK